ncbi:O-antigen ligase family protein [Dyadobacter sp. CY327]|uniref:O-antigen ligase family protein n=1 Tax=Dyadobacter sp. CY327 TaxID=2907301 RepID=UPI001F19C2CA|nr:O-antigen ligase family protein [Dyadobacter sp. CY327]MCE7070268.1 O-antigen ligase family protein [Dyadobacter sp. CY327]
MEIYQISTPSSPDSAGPVRRYLRRIFWDEKLQNIPGMLFLLLFSVGFGWANAVFGLKVGVLIIAALVGVLVLYGIVTYPKFGIIILLMLAIFVFSIIRLGINFPWGTAVDGVEILLMLGFFISQKKNPDWKILKGPVSTIIVIWVFYNFLQVGNPTAESRLAWVYTIRSVAIVMLTYFVFVYQINTIQFLRLILKLWLGLSVIGALYGFKQEFIGFSDAENEYLYSDPLISDLLFINGHWRKFSIFSDPVAFSYHMVVSTLLCVGLISGNLKIWKKVVLGVMAVIFVMAMLYSGTRGAYVLLPGGLIMFCILKFSKKILVFAVFAFSLTVVLVLMPTSDPTLFRFQSAFKPSDDASFNTRAINQKRIQPFIQSHPFGGGLGATGVWGVRFAPNSYLAKFPPDSGYVRVAVELGWVGLFIFCCLMFTILKVGIDNYFQIRNPELKTYCLCMLLIVFAYNLGNYPQEALVQFPANIYFSLTIAIISVTRILDQRERKRLTS